MTTSTTSIAIPPHATRLRDDDGVAFGHAWNDTDGVHCVADRYPEIESVHPGEHGFVVARMVCMRRHLAPSAAAAVLDAEATVLRIEAFDLVREVDSLSVLRLRTPAVIARMKRIGARMDEITARLPVLTTELRAAERKAAQA